jgi:hypothetical protein
VPPALRGQQPSGDTMPPRDASPVAGGAYRPPARAPAPTGSSSTGAYRPPGRR